MDRGRLEITRYRRFHEKLLCMNQNRVTRKKMVSFDEYFDAVGEVKFYKLGSRSYQREDFCFMEMEEAQLSVSPRGSCLPIRSQENNYKILSVVMFSTERNCSVVHKFLHEVHIGQDQVQAKSNLFRLQETVQRVIGSFHSWFVEVIPQREEFDISNRRVRLVITSQNISLLDHSLTPILFLVLQHNDFEVEFDKDTNILTIRVVPNPEWSILVSRSTFANTLKLQTPLGEDIKITLLTVKATRDGIPTPCIPSTEDSSNPSCSTPLTDRKSQEIIEWIRSSKNGNNDPADESVPSSDINVILRPPQDKEPPKPCVPRPSELVLPVFHRPAPIEHDELSESRFITWETNSIPEIPQIPPKGHRIRAESVNDILLRQLRENHVYVNIEYWKTHSISVYEDDNPYDRVYYSNVGWIRYHKKTSMVEKLRRRTRLSEELKDVDFHKIDQHEQWYDTGFLDRHQDLRYRRVSQTAVKEVYSPNGSSIPLNILPDVFKAPSPHSPSYSSDPYWNSDLCLSIQKLLEQRRPNLAFTFDVTFEQMVGICIYLSIEKTVKAKDWRHLAALLGLSSGDIEIIQHFCYTYREWTAAVVLCHWKFLEEAGRKVPGCSHDNLRYFISKIGRDDVMKIFQSSNTNQQIQVNFIDEETWL